MDRPMERRRGLNKREQAMRQGTGKRLDDGCFHLVEHQLGDPRGARARGGRTGGHHDGVLFDLARRIGRQPIGGRMLGLKFEA